MKMIERIRRRRKHKKGFTLTEVIIASVIAMILISVILVIFRYGRRAYDYASYSYVMGEKAYLSVQWLRRDFQQTTLSTIRVYNMDSSTIAPNKYPGFSMIGSIDTKTRRFKINRFGYPEWNRHVFYTLVPDKKRVNPQLPKTGTLFRWEMDPPVTQPNPYPQASSLDPTDMDNFQKGKNHKAVLRNVVLPGQDLDGDGEKDKYKSLKVMFVRKKAADSNEFVLSTINPSLVNDSSSREGAALSGDPEIGSLKTSTNTELVHLTITVMKPSTATGKANYVILKQSIRPRN